MDGLMIWTITGRIFFSSMGILRKESVRMDFVIFGGEQIRLIDFVDSGHGIISSISSIIAPIPPVLSIFRY
jgi:hypothetical protein